MTERPILFNAPMVRSLLDGTKAQTRRVVKRSEEWPANTHHVTMLETRGTAMAVDAQRCSYAPEIKCPYGKYDDRLWVKETHWRDDEDGAVLYAADANDFEIVQQNKMETGSPKYNWKPSIFMPRIASRMTLEITGVRVERLQNISEADAIAEGCRHYEPANYLSHGGLSHDGRYVHKTALASYEQLWESINGPDSWAANPWVWVITFKRLKP